jgi:hypothetical protein
MEKLNRTSGSVPIDLLPRARRNRVATPERNADNGWLVDYNRNRPHFPPDELAKYAGQQVAFNLEGTRILASAPTEDELQKVLASKGIAPNRVVVGYVDLYE